MTHKESCSARLGRVGGQAVLEGVMMKSGERTALAVRDESGAIRTSVDTHTSVRKKYKFLNIPLVRGVVNFVETMILSYNTLMQSADMLGIDDAAEDTKFEAWLRSKWGDKLMSVLMGIATVLGLVVAEIDSALHIRGKRVADNYCFAFVKSGDRIRNRLKVFNARLLRSDLLRNENFLKILLYGGAFDSLFLYVFDTVSDHIKLAFAVKSFYKRLRSFKKHRLIRKSFHVH